MEAIKNIRSSVTDVKNRVLAKDETEKRVYEALANVNWGASTSLLNEISRESFDFEKYSRIMKIIWASLDDSSNWRSVFKSLTLLDYLVKNGNERVVEECRTHMYKIRTLEDYSFYEQTADKGSGVREKAKQLRQLLSDNEFIREERQKAREIREKLANVSSFNASGSGGNQFFGSSSNYDNRSGRYFDNSQSTNEFGHESGEYGQYTDGSANYKGRTSIDDNHINSRNESNDASRRRSLSLSRESDMKTSETKPKDRTTKTTKQKNSASKNNQQSPTHLETSFPSTSTILDSSLFDPFNSPSSSSIDPFSTPSTQSKTQIDPFNPFPTQSNSTIDPFNTSSIDPFSAPVNTSKDFFNAPPSVKTNTSIDPFNAPSNPSFDVFNVPPPVKPSTSIDPFNAPVNTSKDLFNAPPPVKPSASINAVNPPSNPSFDVLNTPSNPSFDVFNTPSNPSFDVFNTPSNPSFDVFNAPVPVQSNFSVDLFSLQTSQSKPMSSFESSQIGKPQQNNNFFTNASPQINQSPSIALPLGSIGLNQPIPQSSNLTGFQNSPIQFQPQLNEPKQDLSSKLVDLSRLETNRPKYSKNEQSQTTNKSNYSDHSSFHGLDGFTSRAPISNTIGGQSYNVGTYAANQQIPLNKMQIPMGQQVIGTSFQPQLPMNMRNNMMGAPIPLSSQNINSFPNTNNSFNPTPQQPPQGNFFFN